MTIRRHQRDLAASAATRCAQPSRTSTSGDRCHQRPVEPEYLAYMLKYDSVHGRFKGEFQR